ncbi:beta-Ig-H3/fasciclin [Stanieria sp. NIES-3757]|nr:beta-Ig-H3/fasciclin [Stanieria sp. NIES-3757]
MNTTFNYAILPVLSITAFANLLSGQVAQAEMTEKIFHSASQLTETSNQNASQGASNTLAQTDTEIYQVPPTDLSTPSQQIGFTDVDNNYWAYPFIQNLAAQNLIAGFPDGSFQPDQLLTRAQAAVMIQKAFELPILEVQEARFSDVPVNHWAAPAIESAYTENFVSAYPNNFFLPDQSILKVELIDYLTSGLKLTSTGSAVDVVNTNYTDAQQIPVYAIDEVAAATEANMVVNYPDIKTFNPQSPVTRAEMVAHLYQTLVKLGKVQPISANEPAATYIVGGPGKDLSQTAATPTNLEEEKTRASSDTETITGDEAQKTENNQRSVIGPTAPSYLGIGGSLGLINDEFGNFGAFAVTSKLRLFSVIDSNEGGTDLSVRPSVVIGEDVTLAIPVTLDLRLPPFKNTDTDAIVPYFGPGVVITTGSNSAFKFLMAGGLDIPIGRFTANTQLNIGFLDETALGLTLGIGYNF